MTQRLTLTRGSRTLFLTDDPHLAGLEAPIRPGGNDSTWVWVIPLPPIFFLIFLLL